MDHEESEERNPLHTFDPREADANYKPFPAFAEWASKATVNLQTWARYCKLLDDLKTSSPDLWPRLLEIVKRAAAWDTGAVEGLYETDRGFTLTVAMEVATWETQLQEKGDNAQALFQSQLKAYDYVLDFATQRVPIAEAWIRRLHEVICESQDTYRVWTPMGWQNHPLLKGQYKTQPNHVIKTDGSVYSWAPVDLTPTEMHRLCEDLRSEIFMAAHPVLQAAYAHYAFVRIHPFVDGNGRVARALASVFTYRAQSIPLLILKGDSYYRPSLEAADRGDFQRFTDFVLDKTVETIRLTEESLKAASAPSLEEALNKLTALYILQGAESESRTRAEEIGKKLFESFKDEMNEKFRSLDLPNVIALGTVTSETRTPTRISARVLGTTASGFMLSTAAPFAAAVHRVFQVELLELPGDAKGAFSQVVIRCLDPADTFDVRFSELTPDPTTSVRMRLAVWCDRLIAEALNELATRAADLRKEQN